MEWGKSHAVDEVSDVFEEEFKIFACPVIRTHKYIVSDGRLKHHRRCDSNQRTGRNTCLPLLVLRLTSCVSVLFITYCMYCVRPINHIFVPPGHISQKYYAFVPVTSIWLCSLISTSCLKKLSLFVCQ